MSVSPPRHAGRSGCACHPHGVVSGTVLSWCAEWIQDRCESAAKCQSAVEASALFHDLCAVALAQLARGFVILDGDQDFVLDKYPRAPLAACTNPAANSRLHRKEMQRRSYTPFRIRPSTMPWKPFRPAAEMKKGPAITPVPATVFDERRSGRPGAAHLTKVTWPAGPRCTVPGCTSAVSRCRRWHSCFGTEFPRSAFRCCRVPTHPRRSPRL